MDPFSFVAFGQSGLPTSAQASIAARLESMCPAFYIAAGTQVIRNNVYTANSKIDELAEPSLNVQAIDHRWYNTYAKTMARSVFYAAAGDDTEGTFVTTLPRLVGDYDDAYALPSTENSGESGDHSSEKYYSFDYGSAHFTVLRSQTFNNPEVEAPGDFDPKLRGVPRHKPDRLSSGGSRSDPEVLEDRRHEPTALHVDWNEQFGCRSR